MRPNKMRQLLAAGKPTLGTHLFNLWPSVVEVVGHSGMFDYVEFVAEYAPYDLFGLDDFCRAAELHDLGAMIKVDQEPRTFTAQRAIGAGFQSVLFADIRTVDDARTALRAIRPETPNDPGVYGVAMRRNAFMTYGGTPDYVQALREIVAVLMIEKKSAVEHLEEILAVGGIDMVQWGPADYGMSANGFFRSVSDTQVVERRVIDTCLRAGVAPRIEINSPDQAKAYLDIGVRHFCIGTDLFILFDWFKRNGEGMRKALEGG